MKFNGIDVSSWQGDIDWEKVKNSGVEFAIIRTGYGRGASNQVDTKFKQNIKGAKEAKIKVGCYHYSYAESPEDAVNEAEFCLSILGGEGLDLPVYYDIEDSSISSKHDKEVRTQMCISFCSKIQQAGYRAGVYSNKNWFDNYINYDELKNRYTLWLAHYGAQNPSLDCDIWQYSSTGKIDGISGNADLNYMFKDLSEEFIEDKTTGSDMPDPNAKSGKVTATYYTVKPGDTLSKIASSFGTTYQYLAEINSIQNPDLIHPGQTLIIQKEKIKTYTVKSGDTLWGIASKFLGQGDRYGEIKELNNLSSDIIHPGQILKISD